MKWLALWSKVCIGIYNLWNCPYVTSSLRHPSSSVLFSRGVSPSFHQSSSLLLTNLISLYWSASKERLGNIVIIISLPNLYMVLMKRSMYKHSPWITYQSLFLVLSLLILWVLILNSNFTMKSMHMEGLFTMWSVGPWDGTQSNGGYEHGMIH